MKTLHQALEDYLALRHAMGFKLSEARTLLPQFVDFLDQPGQPFITIDWAVCWATQPRPVQPAEWARRLRWVRGFAEDQNVRSSKFYRAVNEIPALLMVAIVILVIVKPF